MRILLTEDEKSLSDALCSILRKQKYEVDAAYDGDYVVDERPTPPFLPLMV